MIQASQGDLIHEQSLLAKRCADDTPAALFPRSHGKPPVDDRRVLSGIFFVNRNGLRWGDAPKEYGPAKTLYNRWKRWSDNGVFARITMVLAAGSAESKTIMIDATCLKAHRTASSLRAKKRGRRRPIGRTKDGINTKLHAVTDAKGRPIRVFMSARQVSDGTGAAALLGNLPKAEWLLADRSYDADWLREAIEDKRIRACIPGRTSRQKTVKYDKQKYKRRNRIEIMFGRLKGLEPRRNSIRPMPRNLFLRNLPRSHRPFGL